MKLCVATDLNSRSLAPTSLTDLFETVLEVRDDLLNKSFLIAAFRHKHKPLWHVRNSATNEAIDAIKDPQKARDTMDMDDDIEDETSFFLITEQYMAHFPLDFV